MLFTDPDRLLAAYERARDDLLAERTPEGHWVGELASSALATATAVSALSLVQSSKFRVQSSKHNGDFKPETLNLEPIVARGIAYLATQQNEDGGFGDTDLSHSNIATTMLVRAAFHLAGAADCSEYHELLSRAETYIERKGGISGLRTRYGKDKTFAVPILTNCALAGLVDWSEVAPLPFELAAFPQSWYRFFRLPVVSYAIPALVAIGQARYFHLPPRNPLVRAMRRMTIQRTLKVLMRMQPDSGGYLEAIPLTSFVVMSLAGIGRVDHPVVRCGVQFLLDTARADGSWPIDTNLATWVTTLAINALEGSRSVRSAERGMRSGESLKSQVPSPKSSNERNHPGTWDLGPGTLSQHVLKWLLECQHTNRHPFTGAAAGGWGWSDLSGAVPDCDDTAGALLALANSSKRDDNGANKDLRRAAYDAIHWLLNLQNRDGGWPTFCRGWGTLPFDRSSPDLTAHAMRAIAACIPHWNMDNSDYVKRGIKPRRELPFVKRRIGRAFGYLSRQQRSDGSWAPLWFGNQDHPQEENPVYGTTRVLLAYRDFGRMGDSQAIRGVRWLVANQNSDGGWGSDSPIHNSPTSSLQSPVLNPPAARGSSIEETAWAIEGLLPGLDNGTLAVDNSLQNAIRQGVDWLLRAVEDGRHRQPAPVGFYFAKLWYYEKLYPLIFTVAALGEAKAVFCQSAGADDLQLAPQKNEVR